MYQCTFCGADIPEDARFCGICGRTPISAPEGQTRISGFRREDPGYVAGNAPAPAISPLWEYDSAQVNEDASTLPLLADDEERRRRAAMLGMGLAVAADAIPGNSVPMVQGTPQIGSVPSVPNAPGIPPGNAATAQMPPAWHAGPTSYIPQAPVYTPSAPTGGFPTHTWNAPTQQPYPKPPKPTPKGGCAPLLIVAILIPLLILGSIVTLAFTAFAPGLSLSGSSSVTGGGTLALHGDHFFPGSSITLTLDNTTPLYVKAHPGGTQTARVSNTTRALPLTVAQALQPTAGNTINADGNGSFNVSVTVDPRWSVGQHTISASEAITHRGAQLTFTIISGSATPTPSPTGTGTVTPTVTPSPTLTPSPGTTATTTALSCINPSSITFGPVSENYASAVSTPVTLCTTGTGSLNWTASWNAGQAPWLALDHNSGTITAPGQAQINVSANASQLAAGNYSTTITFSSQPGSVTESLTVNFTVQKGCVTASTNSLTFNAVLHVSEAPSQTVSVTNCGANGTWSASAKTTDGANWLSASPTSGTLNANTSLTVTINASTLKSTLVAGIYKGTVTFALGTSTYSVNVTFNVSAAPTLTVNNSSSSFTLSSLQCSQSTNGFYLCYLTLANTSQSLSLNWTTSTNLLPGAKIPSGGTLAPGQQEPRVLIEIPANDCANGASITFSGPGNSVTVSWVCQIIG